MRHLGHKDRQPGRGSLFRLAAALVGRHGAYRPAECSYVEIMGRGGCYSRFFRAGQMIVLGAKSSVATAFYEEACVQSLELKTHRAKDALSPKKAEVFKLELF
jgi:hypothetical protein